MSPFNTILVIGMMFHLLVLVYVFATSKERNRCHAWVCTLDSLPSAAELRRVRFAIIVGGPAPKVQTRDEAAS